MKNMSGIIAATILVCSLAGPAWAGLSATAAPGERIPGYPLSAAGKGGGEARINSLLDRFAGFVSVGPSSKEIYNPSSAIDLPISETALFTAFTRAGSPMHAYYSRLGSDDQASITENSRSAAYTAPPGWDRFALPEEGLAALVGGHFVGSGAVVDGSQVAAIQCATSDGSVVQNRPGKPCKGPSVPLPLPIFLTGSGLVALLAKRKRAWNNG